MLGKMLKGLKWLMILLVISSGYFIFDNNCCESEIDYDAVQVAHSNAVNWVVENRETALNYENPMVWGWIGRAAELSSDPRLKEIYRAYENKVWAVYTRSPWEYLMRKKSTQRMLGFDLSIYPDYNLLFFYGMSCDDELSSFDSVSQQLSTEFCFAEHPFSPACITHQLMGFRFMQETGCGDPQLVEESVDTLSDYVRYQAMLDFRVTDVYMQRVFMLVESGRLSEVNPRWIARILDAQFDDGSWANFQPLFPVGGDRYFAFKSKGVTIGKKEGWLHTVSQGLLLTALLLENQ